MRSPKRLFVLLVILLLALSACGGEEPPVSSNGSTGTDATEPAVEPDEEQAEESGEDLPPVPIGLITDLSGRFVSFGTDINLATEMAVQAVNDSGGINGSLLEVEVIDTGGEPDQAVIGLRELVDGGAFAVSGPLSSGEAEVLFAQLGSMEIPVVTGTANKEGITELGQGWAFRNQATNTEIYNVALPAWKETYGIETALLIFDEAEPVSAAAAQAAIPAAAESAGIDIVNLDAPITFTRGQTDFSTVVQRIKEVEADALIIMSAPSEAGLIARELVRQDETRPIVGHPSQNSNSFYEQGGSEISNWVLPSILDSASSDSDTVAFLEAMLEADPEPPMVPEAANYYDNILMLAHVMRLAGVDGNMSPADAREAIRSELLSLADFDGVAGVTTFGGSNDAVKTVYINVANNGELEPLN